MDDFLAKKKVTGPPVLLDQRETRVLSELKFGIDAPNIGNLARKGRSVNRVFP